MKLSEASEALQRIGLSRYEALVFVNLARAGATTAGDVARVSGVNRVQTYRALEGLEARGLVEVTLDRPRRYAARAINDVFEMIAEEKRSELEKLDAVRKTFLEAWPKLSGRTREPWTATRFSRSSFKMRSRFAARARRPCGRTARTSSRPISSSSRSRGPPELLPGVGSRSSADRSVIEHENDERLGKRISSPWAMRSPEGKELSTRMVGLALLAMALVTAAFAVTVARADEGAGTQWNSVLAGINERPTPRDTHARGVAVFELSADGQSMHYKVIAANINNVIMAHIHLGDANTAGPVIVWLYPIGGPPPAAPGGGRFNGVLAQGDFDATKFVGPMAGKPMSALVENLTAGTAYVNIHTDDGVAPPNTGPGDFPGGEIRGQVKPTD